MFSSFFHLKNCIKLHVFFSVILFSQNCKKINILILKSGIESMSRNHMKHLGNHSLFTVERMSHDYSILVCSAFSGDNLKTMIRKSNVMDSPQQLRANSVVRVIANCHCECRMQIDLGSECRQVRYMEMINRITPCARETVQWRHFIITQAHLAQNRTNKVTANRNGECSH